MTQRVIWFAIGGAVLFGICALFGIGNVANYIQVISAIPWFYLIVRVEHLHRKHDKLHKEMQK